MLHKYNNNNNNALLLLLCVIISTQSTDWGITCKLNKYFQVSEKCLVKLSGPTID